MTSQAKARITTPNLKACPVQGASVESRSVLVAGDTCFVDIMPPIGGTALKIERLNKIILCVNEFRR